MFENILERRLDNCWTNGWKHYYKTNCYNFRWQSENDWKMVGEWLENGWTNGQKIFVYNSRWWSENDWNQCGKMVGTWMENGWKMVGQMVRKSFFIISGGGRKMIGTNVGK